MVSKFFMTFHLLFWLERAAAARQLGLKSTPLLQGHR